MWDARVDIDFDKLQEKIVSAGKIAFANIKERHSREHFYFFGFYTSGEYNYLYPTSSSYEGLKALAKKYKGKHVYKHQALEYLMHKWSHALLRHLRISTLQTSLVHKTKEKKS